MSERFRLSGPAEQDLDDIWKYLSSRNASAADQLLDRLWQRFGFLAQHRGVGQQQNQIQPGLRAFPESSYVVYFRPAEAEDHDIEIVRILHGARDAPKQFDQDQP